MRGIAINCLCSYRAYYYRQDIASSDFNFPEEKCVNYLEISEKSVKKHTHTHTHTQLIARIIRDIF